MYFGLFGTGPSKVHWHDVSFQATVDYLLPETPSFTWTFDDGVLQTTRTRSFFIPALDFFMVYDIGLSGETCS